VRRISPENHRSAQREIVGPLSQPKGAANNGTHPTRRLAVGSSPVAGTADPPPLSPAASGDTNYPAAAGLIFLMLALAVGAAFVRLWRGPTLPDRVVALDLVAAIAVGFTATYAVVTGERMLLDVAVVLALIAFLSTVAFAQYVERRAKDE